MAALDERAGTVTPEAPEPWCPQPGDAR
jgi:hypothetical protein